MVISLDIVKDGVQNVSRAMADLMGKRLTKTGNGEPEDLPERLRRQLLALDWVSDAELRLREEGHVVSGEAFIIPAYMQALTAHRGEARELLEAYDWRIHEIVVTAVWSLDPRTTEPTADTR